MRKLNVAGDICKVKRSGEIRMHRVPLAGRRLRHGIFIAFIMMLNLCRTVPAMAQGGQNVAIYDSRPVAKAILMLEANSGQVITYEDPRYAYPDDVVDMTDPEYAKQHPNQKMLDPKPRVLTLDAQTLSPANRVNDPALLTQSVLDMQAASGVGGAFRQVQTGAFTHVFPSQIRDIHGNWVEQGSLLDVPITLPEQKTDGLQALQAIVQAITDATHMEVIVGATPWNLLAQHQCDLAATNEPARTVLMRVLAGTNRKLSWRLLYDPGFQSYALNIHDVDTLPFMMSSKPSAPNH